MGNLLSIISLLVIMAATAMPLLRMGDTAMIGGLALWRYIYAAGALLALVCRLLWSVRYNDLRSRRLERMQLWSAIIFCVAAFLIFYQPHTNDWIAFTLAAAVLKAYSNIMLSLKQSKD